MYYLTANIGLIALFINKSTKNQYLVQVAIKQQFLYYHIINKCVNQQNPHLFSLLHHSNYLLGCPVVAAFRRKN